MREFQKAKKAKMRTSMKMDGHLKNPATAGKTGILAFDIIYCCTTYTLFTAAGLEFSPIKKEDFEKRNAALEKLKALDKAREEYNLMCSVEDTINEFSKPGTELISKAHGKGTVVAKEKEFVTIDFGGEVGIKNLDFLQQFQTVRFSLITSALQRY